MANVPGVINPHVLTPYQQEPTLQIVVDLAKAQQYGVSPGEVRRASATLLSGIAAYASARFLLRYFKSGRLDPYGWYCIAAGLIGLALLTFNL